MASGGWRAGAGRPSISRVDRLLIGARCEAEWLALAEDQATGRHNKIVDAEGIKKSRRFLHRVPLKFRPVVLDRAARKKIDTKGLTPSLAEAVFQLHHLIWNELNGRRRFVTFKTPQGQQSDLIARVAANETAARGITVSERKVRRWWDDYREWCKGQREAV